MFNLVLSCLILVAVCFFIFFVIFIFTGGFNSSKHSFTEDASSKLSSMSTSVANKDDASVTHTTTTTTTENTYNVDLYKVTKDISDYE